MAMALVGASCGGVEEADGWCDPLARPLPVPTDRDEFDVVIFLQPTTDEAEVAAFVDEVEADPRVSRSVVVDQEAAFEEFRRLFEAAPEIVETVTPELLPVSVRLEVHDPSIIGAVGADYDQAPKVKSVTYPGRAAVYRVVDAVLYPFLGDRELQGAPDADIEFDDDLLAQLADLEQAAPDGVAEEMRRLADALRAEVGSDDPDFDAPLDVSPGLDADAARVRADVATRCSLEAQLREEDLIRADES
jgi:hypothetical protein